LTPKSTGFLAERRHHDYRRHPDYNRVGRNDGGIQRRLEVRRPEDLTPLFAACLLTRTICWLHA